MKSSCRLVFVLLILISLSGVFAQDSILPSINQMEQGEWHLLEPQGEALCANGSSYRFFVRPAASDNVLIHFQGGGACWNAATCDPSNGYSQGIIGMYKDQVADFEGRVYEGGMFARDELSNPVRDYSVVLVTYCSADTHIGNTTQQYTSSEGEVFERVHRGIPNTNAALDWTFDNFPSPEHVMLTGCSAGAYGSIFHAPTIIEYYDGVPLTQLGDSGVGSLVPTTWAGIENWNTVASAPQILQDAQPDSYSTPELYATVANLFPQRQFAQYTSYRDFVQILAAASMNQIPDDRSMRDAFADVWTLDMVTSLRGLDTALPNFDYYVAGGGTHCILNHSNYYRTEVSGLPFVDWVAKLLEGDAGSLSCDADPSGCDETDEE